jgi:hypothetical protein
MNVAEVSMDELIQPSQFSTPEDKIRGAFQAAANEKAFLAIRGIEALGEEQSLGAVFAEAARTHTLPFAVLAPKEGAFPKIVDSVFSDRLALEPMTPAQRHAAYELYFGRAAPDRLSALGDLTVTVFAHAADVIRFYDQPRAQDDAVILDVLCRQKEAQFAKAKLGFRPLS